MPRADAHMQIDITCLLLNHSACRCHLNSSGPVKYVLNNLILYKEMCMIGIDILPTDISMSCCYAGAYCCCSLPQGDLQDAQELGHKLVQSATVDCIQQRWSLCSEGRARNIGTGHAKVFWEQSYLWSDLLLGQHKDGHCHMMIK